MRENLEKHIQSLISTESFDGLGINLPLAKDFLLAFVDKELEPLVEKLPNDAIQEVEMLAETQIKAEELSDKEKFSTIDFSTDVITYKDFYDSENIEAALLKVRDMVNDEFLNSFQEILKDERYAPII